MPHIETSDIRIAQRYGKQPKQTYQGIEICELCNERKYWNRAKGGYFHQCKSRLKSGKPISKSFKITSLKNS